MALLVVYLITFKSNFYPFMNFALITEGVSEYRIIKHILTKFFKESEPIINLIQPKIVNEKQEVIGGWNEVLKYCERDEIRSILVENDYLVIQIDSDQSATKPFNISHSKEGGIAKSDEELYSEIKSKLNSLIKPDIISSYSDRIIFAISIHTIECWLLPMFYTDHHKSATRNCLSVLNVKLRNKGQSTIPLSGKNSTNGVRVYNEVLKGWRKKEDIINSSQRNMGFARFVDDLSIIS